VKTAQLALSVVFHLVEGEGSCGTGCDTSASLYRENREPSFVRVKKSFEAKSHGG
jgi:hypothetical protein